ncbi:MAG: DNA alkylation repair protein [Pseudomonadota bacterium]|uniref:DNA alkylation repair protein n=1 Tax=Polaromonas sp. TaxID=1869339 RepID=UPI0017F9F392|nr:DNA alkylation repair protein [Polaromonas sp.]MBA3595621.1 DNA alkylation repair protein [Polaromonas sp.]MDQ3271629.1 DNA alkylation repair protein [Pseudomonadota bacterium]
MAEPLVNQYGADVPQAIARMVTAVHPAFNTRRFVADALTGYDELALMPRGKHIAQALQRHLPADYPKAIHILLASLDQPHGRDPGLSLGSFLYLPHTMFVAQFGLAHFEDSMRAQHALTQRFTAEFSIRAFLQHHEAATLARFRQWASDPSEHVRRLVSEGSRPRLPWASRLPAFQKNPAPVLELLELLKDDPALYVRRSVANNLNDIGKDHPEVLAKTAKRWLKGASDERRWIVQHALRSAVKRGEAGALAALGFGKSAEVAVSRARITPARVPMGEKVTIAFDVSNTSAKAQEVLVDFCIHYVKASGKTSAKVFKLKVLSLAPKETVRLSKTVSTAEMTTRKHHAGQHRVDVLLNGQARALGVFELVGVAQF